MKKKMNYILLLLMTVFMIGCTEAEDTSSTEGGEQPETEEVATDDATKEETDTDSETEEKDTSDSESNNETKDSTAAEENSTEESTTTTDDQFSGYEHIDVDGGDQSGHRQAKVVVDIGFGDREYWAFTLKTDS
ncbi:cobalamin biosynthesis protein CobT [Salimicrobium jeotgali]|nr:cobalamin biosynthesis protein CobT [Salimicrobium jeotgali]